MTVDRGGLRYTITVKDEFSRPLGRFRKDIDQSRRSFRELRRELERPVSADNINTENNARNVQRQATATRRLRREKQQLTRQQKTEQDAIKAINREALKKERIDREAARSARRNFQVQRRLNSESANRLVAERQLTKAVNNRAIAEQKLIRAKRRGLGVTREERQQLGLLTAADRQGVRRTNERRRAIDALRKARERANNERLVALNGELQAQRLITRERERQTRDRVLREQGFGSLIPGQRPRQKQEQDQQLNFIDRLRRSLQTTGNVANRVSFTFRRLFGILAAFTIARELAAGFGRLVATIVTANAAIERSQIGIAAVIASVAEVRNLNGEIVTGAEALTIAQQEARRQTRLLRQDALTTTATFEELADAFQVGLGPGLEAGLDVNQVRVFTRQISLAAQAIGLEQRQLSEEIRSILAGTINPRTTRIAQVLGINNEDIRRAKEAGELFEFLQQEFEGFDAAGQVAANTFDGLVARLTDVFQLLLSEGGFGFFNEIKTVLSDTVDFLRQINDATGEITVNPRVLNAVIALGEGLRIAVEQLAILGRDEGIGAIQTAASALGASIATVARVLRPVLAGFLRIFNLVGAIARLIGSALGLVDFGIFDGVLEALGSILGLLTVMLATTIAIRTVKLTIIVASTLWKATVEGIAAVLAAIRIALTVIRGTMVAINVLGLFSFGVIGLIVAAIAGIVIALAAISGLLDTVVDAIGNGISRAVDKLDGKLKNVLGNTDEAIQGTVGTAIGGLKEVEEVLDRINQSSSVARARNQAALRLRGNSGFARGRNGRLELGDGALDLNNDDPFRRLAESFLGLTDEGIKQTRDLNRLIKDSTNAVDGLETSIDNANEQLINFEIEGYSAEQFAQDKRNLRGFQRVLREVVDGADPGEEGILTKAISVSTSVIDRLLQDIISIGDEDLREALIAVRDQRFATKGVLLDGIEDISTNPAFRQALKLEKELGLDIVKIFSDITKAQQEIEKNEEAIAVAQENRKRVLVETLALNLENERQAAKNLRAQETANLLAQGATILQDRLLGYAKLIGREEQIAVLEAEKSLQNLRRENTLRENSARQRLTDLQETIDAGDELQRQLEEELNFQRQNNLETDETLEKLSSVKDFLTDVNGLYAIQEQQLKLINDENERSDKLARANAELARIRAEGSIGDQFGLAILESFQDLPSRFEFISDTIKDIVSGLGDFIAQTLSDAFDPTRELNIQERFARLLQGIATQVISTLLQLAITAALANAFSGGILGTLLGSGKFAGQVTGAAGFGLNEGGRIDSNAKRKAQASPAHYRKPKGRAKGGTERPSGLHPKDTVPIWTALNEWVIKVPSVLKAGHDVMARINEGRFDTGLLRQAVGLAGSDSRRAVSMGSKGPGYISGGRVRTELDSASQGDSGASGGLNVAIMAPTEESFRRYISGGGRSALLDIIGEDSEEIKTRLGI